MHCDRLLILTLHQIIFAWSIKAQENKWLAVACILSHASFYYREDVACGYVLTYTHLGLH